MAKKSRNKQEYQIYTMTSMLLAMFETFASSFNDKKYKHGSNLTPPPDTHIFNTYRGMCMGV